MDHGYGELKSSSPCRSRNFRASAHFVIRSSNACLGPQVLERLSSGCRKCCADVWEIASHAKENTHCRCNPSLMGESANAARVVHALVSRTSDNDGCLFLLESRASDSEPIKQKLVRIILMSVQSLSSQPSPSLLQHILDGKKNQNAAADTTHCEMLHPQMNRTETSLVLVQTRNYEIRNNRWAEEDVHVSLPLATENCVSPTPSRGKHTTKKTFNELKTETCFS